MSARRPFPRGPRATSVAAVLAASLTTAALARASRAEASPLHVETTLRVLAAIASEVGGEAVIARALVSPAEDARRTRGTSERLARLRAADALIASGSDLDASLLPLLEPAHKAEIRPGGPGFCRAGASGDGAAGDGDAQAGTRPWLDPRAGSALARSVESCLVRIAPDRAGTWARNRGAFEERVEAFVRGRLAEASRSLQGAPLLAHRSGWESLITAHGATLVGTLDPRAGGHGHASPAHVAEVEALARREGARLVLAAEGDALGALAPFVARAGLHVVRLPVDAAHEGPGAFAELHETLASRVATAFARAT